MALTRTMLTAVPTVTLTALLGGADPDAGDMGGSVTATVAAR